MPSNLEVPWFRAEVKKDRMWPVQSFYTEPGEREGCACSHCCQTKIRGAIGWAGITPILGDWMTNASPDSDSMLKKEKKKKQLQHRTEAPCKSQKLQQLHNIRIKTSYVNFFKDIYFISYQQLSFQSNLWHFIIKMQFYTISNLNLTEKRHCLVIRVSDNAT